MSQTSKEEIMLTQPESQQTNTYPVRSTQDFGVFKWFHYLQLFLLMLLPKNAKEGVIGFILDCICVLYGAFLYILH